ncbi:hypothetical protein BD408DRAFT_388400 [Parasitella parasitica]|nr:hypothetical protein BD408DRAFT_388400 [Parasitella parasitica]
MSSTEQQDAPVFTQNQINQLFELVTQQVRQETEERYQGRPLPSSIVEELDHCAQIDNLHKTVQKFRKNIPKYVSEDWVTAEAISPYFTNDLRQHKVDSSQFTQTIYRYAEITRTQARAATALCERLHVAEAANDLRQLAVYGFGSAKLQEADARELTLKAINLPPSL